MSVPTHSIRWLIRRDLDEILNFESKSFAEPWSEEDFVSCLRQRNCIGVVIESDHIDVDGYMLYALHETHFEILRFAVSPECRRTGLATQMIDRLKEKLSMERRRRIHVLVDDSNLAAQLCLQRCGFKATRIVGDSYLFQWILGVSK